MEPLFRIEGEAPDEVSCDVRGPRRDGALTGRAWLTYLELDHVRVDDSYLCDTGTVRYRAEHG